MVQAGHGEGRRKKSKTGEDGSHHTAQVGPGDIGRKKINKRNRFDLVLRLDFSKFQGMSSLALEPFF